MSRGCLLSLSDAQLAAVLDGAKVLHFGYRSRYLAAVADQLLNRSELGDDEVRCAVDAVLLRLLQGTVA
jgi:hypothetical protein